MSEETKEKSLEIRTYGTFSGMRMRYLIAEKPDMWKEILASGQADRYLKDFEAEYTEKLSRTIERLEKAAGVTEELKAAQYMEWVHRATQAHQTAMELLAQEIQS